MLNNIILDCWRTKRHNNTANNTGIRYHKYIPFFHKMELLQCINAGKYKMF